MDDCRKKCEIAQEYSKLGLAVLPIHYLKNGKCSCLKEQCTSIAKHPINYTGSRGATKNSNEIESFFADDQRNIAIATGDVSGVWVIDEDELGAVDKIETLYGKLPATPIASTGKGRHFYFRIADSSPKNNVKKIPGIDVRGDGGYVIAPPSIHANGNQYRWLVSPEQTPFAVAPDWLVSLLGDKQTTKEHVIERARTVEERAIKYLEQVPPAVSGDNGHNATFAVVCRLVELFGNELDDDQLLNALAAWNASCDPPWSESELRHKLNDARYRVGSGNREAVTDNDNDDDNDNWPTLHDDAFCGIVGEIVRAIEPETEADTVGVMVTLLTCCGSAIGNEPYFAVGGDRHTCNLFTCLVGDTASGKGQSLSLVKQLMRSADSDWLNSSIAYGLSSGEGLIERVADIIADALAPVAQTRLLCVESEFAKPMRAMKREGNTLSPLLRAAWDGQTLEVMTRGKSKLRASNAHLSFIGHVTATELEELITSSDAANGFANRFLWVLVQSTKSLPSGGNTAVLNQFVERLKAAIEYSKSVGRVERSTGAEQLWTSVYSQLKNATCPVTERARPMVVRLSLLYALLDCSPTIELRHLKAALALWDYCEQSAIRLFAKSQEPQLASTLTQLVANKRGISRTELKRAINHRITKEEFDSVVRTLCKRGSIVSVVTQTANNKKELFYPGVGLVNLRDSWNSSTPTSSTNTTNPTSSTNPAIPTQDSGLMNTFTNTTNSTNTTNPAIPNVVPATIAELFTWKAMNSANVVQRADGIYWVTNEQTLTPSLVAAIEANQTVLASMVTTSPVVTQTATRSFTIESEREADAIAIDDVEFYQELSTMNDVKQTVVDTEQEQADNESFLAELEATRAQLNG